jgi:hypothetical protein
MRLAIDASILVAELLRRRGRGLVCIGRWIWQSPSVRGRRRSAGLGSATTADTLFAHLAIGAQTAVTPDAWVHQW